MRCYNTNIMKKQFHVMNIKCGGCASTVTNALKERFPDIAVDFTQEPRIVSATIHSEEDEKYLLETLRNLGYPLHTDELTALTKKYLSGKSYVSCMHGRLNDKIKSK